MKENLSNIAVVRACWSATICKYKYPLCVFRVFSVCVSYQASPFTAIPKNDTCLSINFDIILLWSRLADQLLFADMNTINGWRSANSQFI